MKETKCLRKGRVCVGLLEVADFFFFYFLGSSANKDAGFARRLFVSILSFLAASDEERPDREKKKVNT